MVPIVTGISSMGRLTQAAAPGHVLKVTLRQSGNTDHWQLMASGSLPKASAVAEVNGEEVTEHKWAAGHNPWPLWFVRRVAEAGNSNCSFQEVLVRSVTTFEHPAGGEPFADNCDVTLPILVNTRALHAGEELRVHWPLEQIEKHSNKKDSATWTEQARRAVGKQHNA